MPKALRILLDNSVRSLARGFAIPIQVSQGSLGEDNALVLFQISEARSSTERYKQEQLEALPTIAELAASGKIELFTSMELALEHLRNAKWPIFEVGDLLPRPISSGQVPAPIERQGRGNFDPFSKEDGDNLVEFVSWLLQPNYRSKLLSTTTDPKLTDFEATNLRNIDALDEICRSLSEKHYGDAYHLWTATVNDMDYFLTSDKRFSNAVTQNQTRSVRCAPIFPTELVEKFGIQDLKPLPFEYGKKYYYSGLEYN